MLPLICIDVDGTLVGSSHVPTEAVWHAAAAAISRDQHLAMSTARGAFGPTLDYARRLDPNGWHIFHNGGALVHTGTGEIRGTALSEDLIAATAAIADRNDWVIEFYSADDYTVDDDGELAVDHAALVGVPHAVRTRDTLATEIVRVQFVVPLDVVPRVHAEMQGLDAYVVAASSPVMPGVAFVSCTKPGISKGAAIAVIAGAMQIDVRDVMMVGDGDNDVDALAAVGHGVAMGNAVAAAKAVANYEVASVDNDGLVEALALSATL